jgi:Arc/MetJ-type ribon-helix-helix transcriptional regulator
MSKKQVRKLSVSLGDEMASWLKRHAVKRHASVSQVIRDALMPMYEQRHAK